MHADTLGRIRAIAQYSLYEGWRSNIYLLAAALLLACAALAEFAGMLVLSDTWQTRVSIYAFLGRLVLVAVLAVYVISSLNRDRIDKQTEWLLSVDSPRYVYLYGRAAGFLVTGILLVTISAAYPLLYSATADAAVWMISLAAEASIVILLSVFVATTLSNTVTAVAILAAFYILARSMGNILLLTQSPILQGGAGMVDAARYLIEAVHFVMPDLWRYADSGWLAYGEGNLSLLSANLLEALIYGVLLLTAAGIDLFRKNF